MRVRVFEKKEPQEATVRLILKPCGSDQVHVVAVDESGLTVKGGTLLTIDQHGIELVPNVGTSLQFETDAKGKLIVRLPRV